MNIGFAVAAVFGLAGLLIHVFLGGGRIVRPFLKIDMHPLIKWLFYLCFQMVSLMIATMTGVFGWAAVSYHGHPAAAVLGGMAFAAALICVFVAIRGRISLLRFIPFWLFLGMSLATLWGFYGSFWDLIQHPLA
jgi:hypothetical protein